MREEEKQVEEREGRTEERRGEVVQYSIPGRSHVEDGEVLVAVGYKERMRNTHVFPVHHRDKVAQKSRTYRKQENKKTTIIMVNNTM